eukprot:2897238-Karenia_brevis.AAC.1
MGSATGRAAETSAGELRNESDDSDGIQMPTEIQDTNLETEADVSLLGQLLQKDNELDFLRDGSPNSDMPQEVCGDNQALEQQD